MRGLSQRLNSMAVDWKPHIFVGRIMLTDNTSMVNSSAFSTLVCIPITITIAYAAHKEITHKPQKFKVPYLVFLMFLIIASPLTAVPPFTGPKHRLSYPIVFFLYAIGMLVLFFIGWMGGRMAISIVETGVVDAIVWLLTSISSEDPESFKSPVWVPMVLITDSGFLNHLCLFSLFL